MDPGLCRIQTTWCVLWLEPLQNHHDLASLMLLLAGLLSEDLIREEIDGVKEALSRLPQEEQDKRYFRIKRVGDAQLKIASCVLTLFATGDALGWQGRRPS